ncbi:MAG: hypothetical protein WDM79_18900 [Terricaulis sp.]
MSQLLTIPLAADPYALNAISYPGWHVERQACHFYVGGMLDFFALQIATDPLALSHFFTDALKISAAWPSGNHWASQAPGKKDSWRQIAYTQALAARRGEPLLFAKAALVLLACELAAEDAMSKGTLSTAAQQALGGSGAGVYSFMSIVPAVWNIDGFNQIFYNSLSDAEIDAIVNAAGQSNRHPITEMANGATVTFETAHAVKGVLLNRVGAVRAKPGAYQGRRSASENERLDLN